MMKYIILHVRDINMPAQFYLDFVAIICFCLIAEKTSQYTKYSVGDSKYFGVNEITGEIFVAGILFGQANQVSSI